MELSSTCKRFLAALASVVVIGAIGVGVLSSSSIPESEAEEIAAVTTESSYVDMTELSYLTDGSFNGWSGHSIQINKNQELGTLSLRSDGVLRTYQKGVSVHAKGQVTYDISEYSADYTRFVAKVGVDGSRGSNGSIWYQFFASHDGSSWESLLKTDVMTGMTDAFPVDLDIEGYSYLRIYVDPNGSNAADHGTIGAPKLAKADYVDNEISYPRISKVDVYDEEISSHDASYNYENNLSLVREREIVNKIGYWTIQDAVSERSDIGVTLDWILDNEQVSEDVVEVGNLTRTSVFLEVLADLRSAHATDLSDPDYGDVYRRMMIALAAAYSSDTVSSPLVYGHTTANYDYIARYERVKQLFLEGKFSHPDWFCEYHVELMRLLMQDSLRDDETMWFSNYVRVVKKGATGPYSYMGYVKGNFILPAYFDEANREKYDTLYGLSAFDVPYGDSPNARYWMVFNHGGICWNLARTGQSVQKTLGMPSTGLFQPSHEAFLLYTKDAQGRPFWYVGNNNYGWGRSSTTWYGGKPYRLLFNWGKKPFVNHSSTAAAGGTNSGYQYLAQANLNNYDAWQRSNYMNLIANSYEDADVKASIYKDAIEGNEIALDSYDGLIQQYKASEASAEEWYDLACDIIDTYTFYPMAMYDLLNIIKPYLDGPQAVDINIKEKLPLPELRKLRTVTSGRISHVANLPTLTSAK